MEPAETSNRPRPGRPLDSALVPIRWLVWVLVPVLWVLEARSLSPSTPLLGWLGFLGSYNLCLWVLLRFRAVPRNLPIFTLWLDTLLFAALPLLPGVRGTTFFLFGLLPTIVGALRFGPYVGAAVAAVLAVFYALPSLSAFLPPALQEGLPWVVVPAGGDFAALGLAALVLFAVVWLVGYLAQRERESAVGEAAVELTELRQAVAGAQIFYHTADSLSNTLNYEHVLEGMLEAGVHGLPPTRRDDPPGVGVAMFFSQEPEGASALHVVAYRNLEPADAYRRIPGQSGVIAETLASSRMTVFQNIGRDSEMREFASFRRCRAGVCFPLQSGLDQYGVVLLASPAPRVPTESYLELMQAFTSQAAIAFQNTRMYVRLKEERDRIVDSEGQARAKLARDLHDGPVQIMAGASMRLEFIGKLMTREPDKAREELAELRTLIDKTTREMRTLLFTLRPLALETAGLQAALVQLGDKLRASGTPVEISVADIEKNLDPAIAGTVFAIIEEAVNNARKHAGGVSIHVSVREQKGNLIATVQDAGPGFDVAFVEENYTQRGSLGLVNMRERAKLLDGQLTIDSSPGRGTRVLLVVPLPTGQVTR